MEVSHWGGNVAFEERYTLFHRGANLSQLFNRVKWAQQQYYSPSSHALKEMKFPPPTCGQRRPVLYRRHRQRVYLAIPKQQARGSFGDQAPIPALRRLEVPLHDRLELGCQELSAAIGQRRFRAQRPLPRGPKQLEGTEYEHVEVRVVLPEGAE